MFISRIVFLLIFLLFGCIHSTGIRSDKIKDYINNGQISEAEEYLENDLLFVKQHNLKTLEAIKQLDLYYFKAKLSEQKRNYSEASKIYETALKYILWIEQNLTGLNLTVVNKNRAVIIERLCYCYIENKNEKQVEKLTQYVLETYYDKELMNLIGPLNEDKNYILLMNCFTIVHLMYTGDIKQFNAVMFTLEKLILKKKKETSIVLSPWDYVTDIMVNDTFISIFLAYGKLQSGDLSGVSKIQEMLEDQYNNVIYKSLLFGGKVFEVATTERATLFGFGAYGYSLLGQYNKSEQIYFEAMNSLGSTIENNSFNKLILAMLYVLYVDSYLIPTSGDLDNIEIRQKIDDYLIKSNSLLDKGFSINPYDKIMRSYVGYTINLIKTFNHITKAKFSFSYKDYDNCLYNAKEAISTMSRTTPKQLSIDAIYYSVICLLRQNRLTEADEVFNSLPWDSKELENFDFFESWKLDYLRSLISEKKGNADFALKYSKKAVFTIEKFKKNKFFNMLQQITFIEDKSLPYELTIKLLFKSSLKDFEKKQQIFDLMERVKIHSIKLFRNDDVNISEKTLELNDIKAALLNDELLINYFVGTDFLSFIQVSNSDVKLVFRMIDKMEIDELVSTIRNNMYYNDSISKINNESENVIINAGYKLYSLLFDYVPNNNYSNKNKIYLVPHRQLSYLPWNALSLTEYNKGNDYLIDHINISTLPCATMLKNQIDDFSQTTLAEKNRSSFFLGPDAEFKENYLKNLCSKYSWSFFENENASVLNALNELQLSNTIIFNTHAFFDRSDPFKSYIKLYDDNKQGILTMNHLMNINIKANFVVLAGCDTGAVGRYSQMSSFNIDQKFLDADDLLALYRQMLAQGVGNILISAVNATSKEGTEYLLSNIIMQTTIDNKTYITEEVRNSIIKVKSKFKHPYFWGPYVLVGKF